MELRAYTAYENPELPISFWRTAGGHEVDFILGEKDVAIEVKGSARVHEGDIRSLRALRDESPVKHCLVVSLENERRTIARGIDVLPWRMFIDMLWEGEFRLSW